MLFEVHYTRADWHSSEMIIFVFLGVVMGIYGAVFCKLNILWSKTFRQLTWIKQWPVIEVILVCVLTATVSWHNRYTRISGTRLVADLLSECSEGIYDGVCPSNMESVPHLVKLLGIAIVVKALL